MLAAGLLAIRASSLLSCGAGPDEGSDVAGEPSAVHVAEPHPGRTASAVPSPPGFTYIEGTTLSDDGYDAPELTTPAGRMRWDGGRWTALPATPAARSYAGWNEEPASAPLPWTHGRSIVSSRDSILGFSLVGDEDPGVILPDFTALGERAPGPAEDVFAPSAYGSLPSGEVFVFGSARGELGVARWSPRHGATFTPLRASGQYAVFPRAVLARSADDVWLAASATTDHFGPDFPGCQIIVIQGQDSGVLAHWDGRRWTMLPYAAARALSAIHARDDGDVEVIAGGTFKVTREGRWTEIDSRVKARALAAGWKIESERVLRARGETWEELPVAMPEDREGRFVPVAVHVLDSRQVWLEGEVITGREVLPHSPPEQMWLHASLP